MARRHNRKSRYSPQLNLSGVRRFPYGISIGKWRGTHVFFAEEYLQLPTASSITKAVKHALWLAGFWSAFQGLIGSLGPLMGSAKSDLPLGSLGTTFVTVALLAFQAIPIAGALWLLTRGRATSISQALMIQIYWINLFLASTFVVYTVMTAIAVPFELLVYYILFLPTAGLTDERSFGTWFVGSAYWKYFLPLIVLMGVSCLCAWGRIFLFVAPNLIGGTLRISFWQGFWRFFVSVAVGVMPYLTVMSLIFSFMAWTFVHNNH